MRPSRFGLDIILLLAICATLYFPFLGQLPFFDKGEPREAVAVQDILQRGEWLFPLKEATAIPSKPPLFHWSAALASQMSGVLNEATVRFPSALYATLGVLLVYGLGRRLFDAPTAFLGAAILATTQVYAAQALSARVDMTLCFFLTLSLALYYSLYRGFLAGPLWYYAFYAILGIGTLAKGPIGILLPGLVIGAFLAINKRWDLAFKVSFHPGILLTIIIAAGWYILAAARGGDGFVDRQLIQENLNRFFGGSGHNHPVYYYLPYLFLYGLPWSLFLPFLIWDWLKNRSFLRDDQLFLQLWALLPLIFFSLSAGKRPVYLLPLYPALSLLLAAWFYHGERSTWGRLQMYRIIALIAGVSGAVLLIITLGGIWQHDLHWYLRPIEDLLKAKDRANFVIAKDKAEAFGWSFRIVMLVVAVLWFSLAHCLWTARLRSAASRLVLIVILIGWVIHGLIMPVIAEDKSYRGFMMGVNSRVQADHRLFLYGGYFYTDPVVFYRGALIERLNLSPAEVAARIGPGRDYIIMAKQTWVEMQKYNANVPPPIISDSGKGAEGDASLVLVQADGL